jgi:hypothetical protein
MAKASEFSLASCPGPRPDRPLSEKNLDYDFLSQYNSAMKGMMQKRIALLIVGILFALALIPAFYPVEDDALLKDSTVCRAYGQIYTAVTDAFNFDCILGWTRNSSTLKTSWNLPNVLPSSAETRAPPA